MSNIVNINSNTKINERDIKKVDVELAERSKGFMSYKLPTFFLTISSWGLIPCLLIWFFMNREIWLIYAGFCVFNIIFFYFFLSSIKRFYQLKITYI